MKDRGSKGVSEPRSGVVCNFSIWMRFVSAYCPDFAEAVYNVLPGSC